MYINYNVKNGNEYAIATRSVRRDNKVDKADTIYLGRVIDKGNNIFKSKERGLFIYDPDTNTFSKVPPEYQEPVLTRKTRHRKRRVLSVAFGDIFLLDSYLKSTGFYKVLDGIQFRNSDTIRSLLCYYVLCDLSNCYAQEWWELSYAKFLFPKAQLSSQRISDALEDIGSEDAKRGFFQEYIPFLSENHFMTNENGIEDGILIDSTGLPNSAQLSITALSNHNGVISEEIRLIYAVSQSTGFPLFYRYIPGNVVDVSTLIRTVAELGKNKINTRFIILDAGYYTGINADALYDAGISFLCRMKGNYTVYKDILSTNLATLDSKENFVRYHGRRYFIKHIPCMIGGKGDRPAHAYLCKDVNEYDDHSRHLCAKADDQTMSDDELYDEMSKQGIFILISSDEIPVKKLLPLYYTRDQVEKAFNISKDMGKMLPLNIEKEETFKGHLLLSFMSSIVIKMLKNKLKEYKPKNKKQLTVEEMFFVLGHHNASVYEDELITSEPVARANEAYTAFDIKVPITIPFNAS